MADTNNPKLQLRSGISINGDKTALPATRLLISHGKPNFTIQRSPKAQNSKMNPMSPTPAETSPVQDKNNEFVVKSTTFHGVFKPSNISAAAKQVLPQNGNNITNGTENEAAKVVLRRPKYVYTKAKEENDDENVPEFIRRQRRIQERLANQNILDFENRRSGYFTQVLLSPTSPNRQSFVETMASPAVKPGLEMSTPQTQHNDIKETTEVKEQENKQQIEQSEIDTNQEPEASNLNGQIEEEEVAKAIEEVNRAVEGEDDDKIVLEERASSSTEESKQEEEYPVSLKIPVEHIEEIKPEKEEKQHESANNFVPSDNSSVADILATADVTELQISSQNGQVEEKVISGYVSEEHIEQPDLNGENLQSDGITISHTNALDGSRQPVPDSESENGVNFETKTVVSFSQELGNDENKYPDTVKVIKDVETAQVDSELKELSKLKFEIKASDEDIQVKPILTTETA